MRELKFRAWKMHNGKLRRYVCSPFGLSNYTQSHPEAPVLHHQDVNDIRDFMPDVDVIEQYTGLKDKNGKEIYEGDILRWEYRFMDGRKSTNTMIVRWNQSECCFEIHFIKGNFGDSMLDDNSCDEYEVIGNIHKGSELVGDKE